ncbi:MAG: GTP-binding protein [Planctomycetota bacterium]
MAASEEEASTDNDRDLWAALDAVRRTIDQVEGCSNAEKEALAGELAGLRDLAKKLRGGRVEIVVFGEISTGKSALINALTGRQAAEVNVRGGWTKEVWRLGWEGAGYCLPGFEQSEVVLVDTPGLNEVGGAERAEMARQAAERAELILFVTDSDLNETEHNALVDLAATHKPILLVVNKTDLYTAEQLDDLMHALRGDRLAGVIEPENIVTTSADPRAVQHVIESADGSTREDWRKPPVEVDQLRARILEVLQADGSALVALSASMYAADRSDRIAALRVRLRNERATQVIGSYAVTKALTVAFTPPAVDVAGGAAVDAAMVATLANVYGINLTMAKSRTLVVSILKAAGWMLLAEAVVGWTSSVLKGVTFGATAVPQAAAAGYGSYIVGQAARYYFEHGASWGDRGAKQIVADVLANTDKRSVIAHLKDEIRNKLATNRHAEG